MIAASPYPNHVALAIGVALAVVIFFSCLTAFRRRKADPDVEPLGEHESSWGTSGDLR